MARILIHSLIFEPDGVSTAYLYSDLARGLKRCGHSVSVLTTTPHFNLVPQALDRQPLEKQRGNWLYSSDLNGINVWHLKMDRKAADLRLRLRSILKFHARALMFGISNSERYDVILSPSPPLSMGLVTWMLAKKYHARGVYNVQEIYPDFAIGQGAVDSPIWIWMMRKLEKLVYACSEKVVTIDESFTYELSGRGVPQNKLATIPNFVDTNFYRPVKRDDEFIRAHGLFGKFVVMYAGNIGYAQEWEPLLHAARQLSGLDLKFVVIGDGAGREGLKTLLAENGYNNVLMLDYQPREIMPKINACCDIATIVMNPRTASYVLPSKILTTMACEKPTVAGGCERSGISTIIDASGCGSWVKNGDVAGYANAINSYYQNQNKIKKEGRAGRNYVQQNCSMEKIVGMYDQMLSLL